MAQPPLTVPIAGWRHQPGAAGVLKRLQPGVALRLAREPDNPFDQLAVGVFYLDRRLGYCPRANNVDVAWALDGKLPVKAVFAGLQEQGQPVMQIVW
jgi:hypothetical protein